MTAEPDATLRIFEDWSRWTSLGKELWAGSTTGSRPPDLTARLDEAADKAFEAEDLLATTPSNTLAGVAGKLRIFAHHCAEQGGEPAPEDRLALSALADIERMIGEKR